MPRPIDNALRPSTPEQVGHLALALGALSGVRVEGVDTVDEASGRRWAIRAVCVSAEARDQALAVVGSAWPRELPAGVVTVALRVG